MIDPKIHRC